jgi:hypothetical protein
MFFCRLFCRSIKRHPASTGFCWRHATKGSGGFPTAERARQEDRFNNFEMNNGRLENRPSVSRQNRRKNAR